MELKIGDMVEFTNLEGNYVSNYSGSNIPNELVKHGTARLHNDYKNTGGEVLWTNGVYAYVRTKMFNNRYLQLGYPISVLRLKMITDWESKFKT